MRAHRTVNEGTLVGATWRIEDAVDEGTSCSVGEESASLGAPKAGSFLDFRELEDM